MRRYGYTYDTDKWEWTANPFLSHKFRMYESFGDGLTQHSHDWPVTEEFATDYLFSLAAVMAEDEELVKDCGHLFGYGAVDPQRLKFAASLVFNPDKDKEWNKERYYSVQLMKVTRNRDKEHDDRYKKLNEYQDGSPQSILALVMPQHADGLERWQCADSVRNWCADNMKTSLDMPAIQLGWFKEGRLSQGDQYQKARDFRDAVGSCHGIAEARRLRSNGVQGIENYRNALQRKAEREAQAEAHNETPETAETESATEAA